jgi:hypothetical protein
MKTVFIFGAGASKDAGAPLMADFLDRAEDLSRSDPELSSEESFKDVLAALAELQGVHAKSYLDLNNIEVIFGAIEMAQILQKLGNRDQDSIARLRTSIVNLIVKTLEHSVRFRVSNDRIVSPEPYSTFLNMLEKLHFTDFSFMTFNYDLALDFALTRFRPFDYYLSGSSPRGMPYLKLHGSINWGRCSKCDSIIPYNINEVNFPFFISDYVYFDLGSKLSSKKHCDFPLSGPPVLIPPTWNKTASHPDLLNVWRRAAIELSHAENVFVIGYSMPETDLFFRYLYALGAESTKRIRRFWVINTNREVEERFLRIIGRGIESRFEFLQMTFENAIGPIKEELARAFSLRN